MTRITLDQANRIIAAAFAHAAEAKYKPLAAVVVDADNQPIGGVGISGDLSDNDEKAVLAGIMAAGLSPQA